MKKENKTKVIQIRITEKRFNQYKAFCKELGMNMTDLIIDSIEEKIPEFESNKIESIEYQIEK